MKSLMIRLMLAAFCVIALNASTLFAQTHSDANSSLPGEEILNNVPWFNPEKGSIKSIPVQTRSDDSVNRNSRWLPNPNRLTKKTTPANTPAAPAAAGGGGAGTGMSLLAWVFLILTVAILVGLIIYAFSKSEIQFNSDAKSTSTSKENKPNAKLLQRINELPAELRRTDVNMRDEAYRLMNEGQYNLAIILLFSHQLLLLDSIGHLRLSRGKTNGKYVREVRSRDVQCADWLRETATAFERSYFGQHELSAELFERLWEQNLQLESACDSRQEAA